MAIFSVNQVRQFYVATAYKDAVAQTDDVGTIGGVKVTPVTSKPDVELSPDRSLYFLYRGYDTMLKSDRIQLRNLNYIKYITPEEMRIPLKKVEVTIATGALSDSKPIVGQDYVLRINFRQFYGMSDQDVYIKDAAVHVTNGMTASDFYKKMVASLSLAFSREVGATVDSNPYVEFLVGTSGDDKTAAEVIADLKKDNPTITATKIIIKEKLQGWTRGIQSQERVFFDVCPTTIGVPVNPSANCCCAKYDDIIWGEVNDVTPPAMVEDDGAIVPNDELQEGDYIGNGTTLADMEWFYMGERADQYRLAGWPNYIHTEYLLDPTKEYYVVEIHYGFTDTGVNSYRSEKDITIVSDDEDVATGIYSAICNKAGLFDIPNLKKTANDLKTAVLGDAESYSADTSLDSRVTTLEG